MADETQTRVDGGIVEMWRKDGWLYGLVGVVLGLALGVIILPAIGALENGEDVRAFLNDLAPELIGILITVFVIDRLNRRRDERNAEEALKRQLVMDAGSISNETAKNAVHQLRNRGWLTGEDGLLKGKILYKANLDGALLSSARLDNIKLNWASLEGADLRLAHLQGADLLSAQLEGADLRNAFLQSASLYGANLQSAVLGSANLQRANLREANLLGANLGGTNLQESTLISAILCRARLYHANLQGANLASANLQGARLAEANLQDSFLDSVAFDTTTVLPDDSYWRPGEDLTRFTDPSHPFFWRSDDPESPAYRGKSEE